MKSVYLFATCSVPSSVPIYLITLIKFKVQCTYKQRHMMHFNILTRSKPQKNTLYNIRKNTNAIRTQLRMRSRNVQQNPKHTSLSLQYKKQPRKQSHIQSAHQNRHYGNMQRVASTRTNGSTLNYLNRKLYHTKWIGSLLFGRHWSFS